MRTTLLGYAATRVPRLERWDSPSNGKTVSMPRKSDLGPLWKEFERRVRALAERRGRELRLLGNAERAIVELDSRPYLVFVPNSALPITRSRAVSRAESWASLRDRKPAGYIILAANAELSSSMKVAGVFDAPRKTAVVGRWGAENDLAISQIDDEMALILEAAGVPEPAVLRGLQQSQATAVAADVSPGLSSGEAVASLGRLLRPGHLIDAYRLEKRLGRGHSAEVWKATVVAPIAGVGLNRGTTVALKLYSSALLQGFETLRIQREFTVAVELRHPNLARVFDLVLSPSRPHHAFLAMEFVDGPTLKSLIESSGRLSVTQTLRMGEQLFGALDEIHTQGALHRDVKGANILVASHSKDDIAIKLVDLGIVSIPSEDRLTQASVFLGSKHSAPLEQLKGQPLDERTDIYGAGSVLFHALTGHAMYQNTGPEGAIVVRMLERPEQLPVPRDAGRIEEELAGFVNRCIALKSSDRPASAADCIEALRRIRSRSASDH
jgi:tRNA A-37 threonylcarbamoyl transferase component Bud32